MISGAENSMVLFGSMFNPTDVSCGVLQDFALRPLLFFIFINYISLGLTFKVKVHANDCITSREITSDEDHDQSILFRNC